MHVLNFPELGGSATTCRFDGADHGGVPVSLLVVDCGEGEGPELQRHAYHEVFVILDGEADLTAGGRPCRVGPGSIAVVNPETFHTFTVVGPRRLRSVHIHVTEQIHTTWKSIGQGDHDEGSRSMDVCDPGWSNGITGAVGDVQWRDGQGH